MTEADEVQFSLLSLEDELTCSICLSTFECPVTIPCGHNFCQDCLLATWKDTYSCPQCRTHFATRPELKKNTVLSTVVDTFRKKSSKSEGDSLPTEGARAKKQAFIRCDTCMEAEAAKTCLTCMASFCEEHLRPHRENPNFRLHQLQEPLGDLWERICPDHHKLMELFCVEHHRLICSFCLQQVHKGCSFISPEEQRQHKESDLRGKLALLNGKITKNEDTISQMKKIQDKLKDSATSRKKVLAAEYQQMRDMLDREEREALNVVDRELDSGQSKLNDLIKKFTKNIENMSKAKEDIFSLLGKSQTQAFLQASFNLPTAVNFDPYAPRINLDSRKVTLAQTFTAVLKEHLIELFKRPVEARLAFLKPGDKAVPVPGFSVFISGTAGPPPEPETFVLPGNGKFPRSHSPGPGFSNKAGQTKKQRVKKPPHDESAAKIKPASSTENLLDMTKKNKQRGRPAEKPGVSLSFGVDLETTEPTPVAGIPPSITSAEKRSELLKYGAVFTLDPKTAHKRITLTEDFTKASVTEEPTNYPDCRERFSVCSQVLSSQGFSSGRHYWEVRLSSNNFIGVGLAYNSIDRKGPASRLGRNAQSWCVEWFNVKLSAWHNSNETVLVNPSPKRVGVLLDCDEGMATFYNVADRAYPFHSFVFPFAEALYPAFWIFSSGSSVTLCKLQQ